MEPWPWTIRELQHAAEQRLRFDWDHTAELMALNANIHAKGKYSRNDFHPLRETAPKNLADPSKIFRQLKVKENGNRI